MQRHAVLGKPGLGAHRAVADAAAAERAESGRRLAGRGDVACGLPLAVGGCCAGARGARKLALAVLRPYARARQRHGDDERRGRTGARGARALGQANAEPAADGDFAARLARGAATRAVRVSCTVVGTQNHDRSSLQVVSKNS